MRYAGMALAVVAWAAAGGAALAAPGRALERSVRAADLVVLAEGGRVARSSPRPVLWAFQVTDMLKGDGGPAKLQVDLEKAPVGLWPRKGERAILCLTWSKGGAYQLTSHFRSILPADEVQAVREVVAAAATAVRDVSPATDTAKPGVTRVVTAPVMKHTDPATEAMKQRIAGSDTILVGVLSSVRPSGRDSEGIFKVQESLLGYDGFAEPISVRIKRGSPDAGRYVLFLQGSLTEATFSTASGEGAVRIADAAAEKKVKSAVRSALPRAKGKVLTTIQATVAEWQSAWNARSLERCIRCYSSASDLKKTYDSGAEGRTKLEKQMAEFPAKVSLSLQSISLSPRPGMRAADVKVMLKLTTSGVEDRRTATMQLVHEGGEWLILSEGF